MRYWTFRPCVSQLRIQTSHGSWRTGAFHPTPVTSNYTACVVWWKHQILEGVRYWLIIEEQTRGWWLKFKVHIVSAILIIYGPSFLNLELYYRHLESIQKGMLHSKRYVDVIYVSVKYIYNLVSVCINAYFNWTITLGHIKWPQIISLRLIFAKLSSKQHCINKFWCHH